jgi:murein L,D-transpeptidase YcbB/YkuD
LSQALIAAGEATRGQKGMGGIGAAFGGFGKTYNAATAAAEERAAKQQALERAQTIETMKLQADIEQMQRAFAEGRFEEGMKLKDQVNARQAKIEEIKGAGATEVLNQADKLATQADRQRQRDEQARHHKEVEKYQQMQAATAAQRAKFDREDRPTGEDKKLAKVMTALNNDPQYKALLKRQAEFNPADAEFDAIQDVLDSIRNAAFKDAKLTAPTLRERLKSIPKPEEKGFFANLFGGSSPSSSKAVPFDQLPK